MLAPPGPRGSRGSRLTTRGRATYSSRGNRAGPEDHAARRARSTSGGRPNAATSGPSKPSSRGGYTRGPSRRATSRGQLLSRVPPRQPSDQARPSRSDSKQDTLRDATTQDQSVYRKYMETTFTTLGEQRKQERKDAITDGLLADPDKPTTLANAITIVGTCQHMCAEFERVQRIVQFMVDDCEKVQHSNESIRVPSEDRMIKRYRRPAAGYEEQLPSDIRPPLVLQKTLDYLMDEVLGGPDPLSKVHKFIWDRTRAIRNDFSIQQVTKVEDLRIAISCFERIARFHILSLHQLAGTSENSIDFDAYQEREQLNNTLLSLIYYYDDSRHRLVSPNESEFRAYCIIFEIQDQRPDLEDRAQNWPISILKDHRVQTALKLYAAAASASDPQGPLRPQAPHAIAQANVPFFFTIVQSPAVPYLMACVAEIYFNKVRRMALDTIWKAYKIKRGGNASIEDWTLTDATNALGFDDEEQAQTFCEEHGLTILEKEGREAYVDLGSVSGRYLSDANPRRKQPFSFNLVEQKRRARTLPATINGLTVAQAQAQGLVMEDDTDNEGSSTNNDESLFLADQTEPTVNGIVPSAADTEENVGETASKANPPFQLNPSAPSFNWHKQPSDISKDIGFFGKPSEPTSSQLTNPIATPSYNAANLTKYSPLSDLRKPEAKPSPFSDLNKPDIIPATSGNSNKEDSILPRFNASGSPGQSHQDPSLVAPSSKSILDFKPFAPASSAKVSFETSPLFSQNEHRKPAQAENDADIPAFSSVASAQSTGNDPQPSDAPLGFSNHTEPDALQFRLPPHVPTDAVITAPVQQSLPPPIALSLPPTAPPSKSPIRFLPQTDQKGPGPTYDFAKPTSRPSTTFSFSQSYSPAEPLEQPVDQTAPASATPMFTPQVNSPEAVVATPPPDPRPAVLDALTESLMMDDQGLLQQYIEYTVGPIIHHAFLEVEDDRSWSRAREIRIALLSRKYSRRWKDNVWAKKLLRKGKERRAIFARSMQKMARSSRRRQHHSVAPSNPGVLHANTKNVRLSNMAPPSAPQSESKRRSLPTDFEGDKLPNAEIAFRNKRKRQEPPSETQSTNQSLRTSFQPHHKRSRTMGDSRKPQSVYDGLADFSHLDEKSYDNERVLQQARRLVGHAKLDTTRGDYFALKSRGIDPDTPLLPQVGVKRSRVDEQIARVQKLLKPSSPALPQSALSGHPSIETDHASSRGIQANTYTSRSRNEISSESPNHLLAQLREVREALAEGTAWFQAEREKSERLSSSRSSEVPPPASVALQSRPQSRPLRTQAQELRPTPTRAQIRLERTRANGLLPPDWDWNKSVTDWKLRGGTGRSRASASRNQSGRTTSATAQQKKAVGFAAMTNGLGRRPVRAPEEDDEIYNDQDEPSEEDEMLMNGGPENADEEYPEIDAEVYGEEARSEDEDEEDEGDYEEEEGEDDLSPERALLQGQGSSADTAIDLD
ncbi:MAG: hypothetical protein LQ337_000083 [Flavoplaca oasis]|nr:MAG: hypothetical protein LQ337_000083 [Flavoplaca oasis]